ncbi:hypothetical protein EGR_10463 [Echinococcus granulosus]|uniref:Uncharacterized protein n=1 Tax=Echinococcus granulosus TaxID=6210 RepID=W6U2A4_ECHGR|nr:hypothetical protein EGR_10463 [Echinococcus granulosus]EUB54681.1 hypothetical protein EGR_10463 [Echinococcus granulosus]
MMCIIGSACPLRSKHIYALLIVESATILSVTSSTVFCEECSCWPLHGLAFFVISAVWIRSKWTLELPVEKCVCIIVVPVNVKSFSIKIGSLVHISSFNQLFYIKDKWNANGEDAGSDGWGTASSKQLCQILKIHSLFGTFC